jgi:hypothetical protein
MAVYIHVTKIGDVAVMFLITNNRLLKSSRDQFIREAVKSHVL